MFKCKQKYRVIITNIIDAMSCTHDLLKVDIVTEAANVFGRRNLAYAFESRQTLMCLSPRIPTTKSGRDKYGFPVIYRAIVLYRVDIQSVYVVLSSLAIYIHICMTFALERSILLMVSLRAGDPRIRI